MESKTSDTLKRRLVALLLVAGACSSQPAAPSRSPERAQKEPERKANPAPPKESEPSSPAVCAGDAHYDEAELAIWLEADEPHGSRFQRNEHGTCGDVTLSLVDDGRTMTLSATRGAQTAVLFREPSDFVMLAGCTDLTGDGVPELVVRRPGGSGTSSTEIVSLEATPKSLFKTTLDLELKRTQAGPFPYELLDDDQDVYTLPQLPVVVAYQAGHFERVGTKHHDYWLARRKGAKQALECEARASKPLSRALVNTWFSTSLYVGDWDGEKKTLAVEPARELELAVARPSLEKTLGTKLVASVEPPSTWLASKDAPSEVKQALVGLSALPALPVTTEAAELTPTDDPNEPPPPPGFRFLATPKGSGALLERCGAYVVEQVSDDEIHSHVRLRDAEGRIVGRIMPEFSIGYAAAEWCFDLTGDGVPELLVTESSGGAHCCHLYRVISLGPTPEVLLEFDAGNGWLEGPENLDGQGPYELLARDDLLTYDAGASPYAGAYFLPVVFVFENGKYVRHTRRWKSLLKKERDRLLAEYREEDPRGVTTDPSGWMALGLLLSDWDKVKGRLPIDPAMRVWFDPEETLRRISRGIEK